MKHFIYGHKFFKNIHLGYFYSGFRHELWKLSALVSISAPPRLNCSLEPTHQRRARGWTGHKYLFSSLQCNPTGKRTQLTSCTGACSTISTT